ncbi:MAG: precorrin-3B C(17)-methyltransferase [Thermodesulfovibrionales bacterium]|nr:precorrin-3B C(17)-methyltransferase [Thermodesulfovibrionales bacterium]
MQESGAMRLKKTSPVIYYITKNGYSLAKKIKSLYVDAKITKFKTPALLKDWKKKRLLIFIMATGIVVRVIAPLLKDKKTDPAILVIDEKGDHVISLLSGHLGSANEFSKEIANFLNSQAVITTSSDLNNLPAIDLWAKGKNLFIENWDSLPKISRKLINQRHLKIYSEINIELPKEFKKVKSPKNADLIITNKNYPKGLFANGKIFLRPKNLVLGIGCNSNTSLDEIEEAVKEVLKNNLLSFESLSSVATVNKKAHEKGLIDFIKKYNLELKTYTVDEINTVEDIEKSDIVYKSIGAKAVAEPCALLASDKGMLIIKKQKRGNVTVAIAEKTLTNNNAFTTIGKIFIVGTGPGNIKHITDAAKDALRNSEYIIGYETYLNLIPDLTKNKNIISTGMTEEVQRCKKAIELAKEGKTVSIISGGDPGIYAMAGLVLELLHRSEENDDSKSINEITIEVIPGISALNACAARLGAPLMHDFASISLSDRLTSWKVIEERLIAASAADFVIVLYNPKSKGRVEHINKAVEIIKKHRKPHTPVGIVRQAMREGETIKITDLDHLLEHEIDMQTTIIIGNSQTYVWKNWIITPRGYGVKFNEKI